MKTTWGVLPVLACVVGMAAYAQSAPSTQLVAHATKQRSVHYDQLPLSFEPNVGQTASKVQWLSRGPEYNLFLTGPDAVLELSKIVPAAKAGGSATIEAVTLRMNLQGGNLTSSSTGEEPQTGKVNYFTGSDQAKWHRNISLYGRVRLHRVYPGIDLAYYGHQGQLEYDFIVAPGADASAIRLRFDGATSQLAANGDLVLPVNGNEIRFRQPVVYQMVNGQRRRVDGAFQMAKNGEVSFHLGAYDRNRELVIDPTLVYTGTFGTGSIGDKPAGMAVDSNGELIIAGTTGDLNFPATTGAYQTTCGPTVNTALSGITRCVSGGEGGTASSAYVAKLSADGTQLIYATYLHGGSGTETGAAVQADASGNAVVVGTTDSVDFPLVNAPAAIPQMSICKPYLPNVSGGGVGPAQQDCQGYFDGGGTEWAVQGTSGFISKLSADGSSLLYSAYMGYSGSVYPQSLALDAAGNMYMLNEVNTADKAGNSANEVYYPTSSGALQSYGVGDYETALTVVSADGQTILYSTIFGETEPIASGCGSCLNGTVPEGIAVGQNGTVFIAGETRVATLPVTPGTVQTTCTESTVTQCANNVGYVAAFDITKSGSSSLEWATYVSGPDNANTAAVTQLNSIAADSGNNVYLTGYTSDALFPTTTGAYDTACMLDSRSGANFCVDTPFVSKLNSSGTAYDWSTFLISTLVGGDTSAVSNAIALDSKNNVYAYGDSGGLTMPAVNPLPQYPNDWYQAYPFLIVVNPAGSELLFASQVAPNNYVGSMQNGLALDPANNIYMVGNTQAGQTYYVGSATLTSWPATQGTYSTAQTGTAAIPFFVKVAALLNPTQTTLSATPSTTIAGQDVTFTATVAGTTQATPAPTGTVTLTNTAVSPATTLGTIDLSAGAGTFKTSSLAAGTYTVVGTYSADSVYDISSSSALTITINTPAQATVALTVPATAVSGASVTMSAKVSGSGTTPTGTVTFLDGVTALNTATLSGGSASYSTSSLTVGSHSITAQYSGDTNYAGAVSAAGTLGITAAAADFSIAAGPASATIAAGAKATTTITLTPSNGFASATTLSCSGLPANATCAFSPASLTPSGSAATSTLTIATNVNASAAIKTGNSQAALHKFLAAGSGAALVALLFWPGMRRRKATWLRLIVLALVSLGTVQALTACGGGSKPTSGSVTPVTPAGTSSITITGTGGSTTHATTFSLTVN